MLEDPAWPEAALDPETAGSFLKLFAASLAGKSVDEFVAMCAATNPTWDAAEFRPWAESKAAFRGSEVIGGSGVGRDDWATLCSAFRVPVLLVCGGNEERGRIVPPSVAARGRGSVPTLESVCFEPAGHNVRREAYDGYVAAVRAFLRRN